MSETDWKARSEDLEKRVRELVDELSEVSFQERHEARRARDAEEKLAELERKVARFREALGGLCVL